MKKLLLLCLFVVGCASTEKVKHLDTTIEEKGVISNGVVGLNDKGEAIIQKETPADQELRALIWQNNQLESDLNHETAVLERCREEIADPRLGGSGDVVEIPEVDNMKPSTDLRHELGLVSNQLKVVSKESFTQRLKAEQTYQSSLEKMVKQVSRHRRSCEIKMGQARRKAGLPSTRFQGQITITPDGKVGQVLAPHENNLDDAFRINKMNKDTAQTDGE